MTHRTRERPLRTHGVGPAWLVIALAPLLAACAQIVGPYENCSGSAGSITSATCREGLRCEANPVAAGALRSLICTATCDGGCPSSSTGFAGVCVGLGESARCIATCATNDDCVDRGVCTPMGPGGMRICATPSQSVFAYGLCDPFRDVCPGGGRCVVPNVTTEADASSPRTRCMFACGAANTVCVSGGTGEASGYSPCDRSVCGDECCPAESQCVFVASAAQTLCVPMP